MVGAGYGAAVGVVVSVLPALTGAAGVVAAIGRRQPDTAAGGRVQRDLGLVLLLVVIVLNAAFVLVARALDIPSWSTQRLLPFWLAANTSGLVMMRGARSSIVAAWAKA